MKKTFLLLAFVAWLPGLQAQSADRITYTVTGTGFTTTEQEVIALTQQITNPYAYNGTAVNYTKPEFSTIDFTKAADINSISFNKAIIGYTKLPSIEFKVYAAGAANPYVSYQVKNCYILRFKQSGAAGGSPILEDISVHFENWGFKDWVNNLSYGFSVITLTSSAY